MKGAGEIRRRSHKSVVLTGGAVACSLAGDAAIYTALPIVFADLGLSPLQVGLLLSVNRFIRLVTNPIADRLIRRVPARPLLGGSLVVGSAIALLYSQAPGFVALVLLRTLWGLCWSVLRQVGVMNAAGRSTNRDPSRLVGLYTGVVRVGFFGGTLLSGIFLDSAGLTAMFYIMAGIMLMGLIPGFAAFGSGELVATTRSTSASGPRWMDDSTPKVDSRIALVEIIKGFIFGAVGAGIVMSTLGVVLKGSAGASVSIGTIAIGIATLNGIILGLRHFFGIVGSAPIGALLDRAGVGRGEILAFLAATAALIAAFVLPGTYAPVVGVLIFSICEISISIALTTEMNRTSKLYAQFASALDAGAATGPLLAWILIDILGNERIGFVAGGILYLIGMICAIITYRRIGPES